MLRKTLFLSMLLLAAGWLKAQTLTHEQIDISEGTPVYNMNAVIYKPANYSTSKKYPLVIFTHGMGEAGSNINEMYNGGLPKVLKDGYNPSFEFIMVAVQATSYSVNAKWLPSILEESQKRWSIDPTRIYLTGLSAGGWTIYQSQLNYDLTLAKKFAAIVVCSGATQDVNKNNFGQWEEAKTPLWAVVGNNDISYRDQNQLMVDEINDRVPGLASITIRSGVGHGGWNDVYKGTVKTSDGKNMWQWLYQFTRGGTDGGTPLPSNQAPTANAGSNKSITLPVSSTTLSGNGSDDDGSIASYKWTKVSGPSQFSFSSTSIAAPTVSNLVEGTYTFRLTVTDNDGATDTDDMNVVVNDQSTGTEPPVSGGSGKTVMVNLYGGSNAYSNSSWNNWNTHSSLTFGSLKYSDGSSSSISATLSQQSSVSDNGSSYSNTMAPKEVVRYASYSTSNRTLTISGLDNSKKYDFEVFASRSGNTNNKTRFAVGSQSVDILTGNNTDDEASFMGISPVSGKIVLSITRLNTYNYINGFTLTETGSSSTGSGGTTNNAPTANAGSNKTITLPTSSTTLNGSGADTDGTVASYKWTKVSGPSQFTISNASAGSTSVSNLVEGSYTFRLTVTDNDGATASDDVNVIVNPAVTGTPPVSGPGKSVKVNLYGGSNAYNNSQWNDWNTHASLSTGNLKYSDGTSSSISATLSQQSSVSDNGSSYTTNLAPKEVTRFASYSTSNRTLTISGLDNSKTYTLEVYASRSGNTNNKTRFAAGGQSVDILTGDNSSENVSFEGLIPSGGKIVLNITKLNTYNYINGFTITEGASGSGGTQNAAPTASAGSNMSITLPTNSVTLNGSGTDSDGSISSITWSKVSGPSQFYINNNNIASPTMSNLVEGSYTFRLTVVDNDGATATDDVNVIVDEQIINTNPPVSGSGKTVMVNIYGGANDYNNNQWNNWNTHASLSSGNLKYNDGSTSPISATLSQQSSVSDNGSSYTTNLAPKEVTRFVSYSTSNRTLTISGLDNSKTYTLEVFASRSGNTNNKTRFSAGGQNADVLTGDNMNHKVSFSGLMPSGGTIILNITKLNTYNYINGFAITEGGSATAQNGGGGQYQTYTLNFSSSGQAYFPSGTGLNWAPGDTVNIPAGNYSLIDLGNFSGDATRPIIIRNTGGVVNVSQIRFGNNAKYFKLLGNGTPGVTYGFKVGNTSAVAVASAIASDFEIAYCEILNAGTGIMIKKNPVAGDPGSQYPNYTIRNIFIHHNYLHDISGEGMYVGHTDPSGLQQTGGLIPIRMTNVDISYNTVERCDWDAIQLASATTGNKIHHNQIKDFGLINKSSQQSGIVFGGNSTGDVYDNNISNGTGPGIAVFGYGQIKVYNNTISNTGNDGSLQGQESIYANDNVTGPENNPKQQMVITNNTIKAPKPKGAIRVGCYNNNSLASVIQNNHIQLNNPIANWLNMYVVSNASGSLISGNNLL